MVELVSAHDLGPINPFKIAKSNTKESNMQHRGGAGRNLQLLRGTDPFYLTLFQLAIWKVDQNVAVGDTQLLGLIPELVVRDYVPTEKGVISIRNLRVLSF